MNTRRLVTCIVFLAVFAMAARISIDTDTWWHLRAGQWILDHRAVPQVDPFSYTRLGAPWQYPGWLVEVPMLWIYQSSGPGGLNLWTALMVTLAFACLWRALPGDPFLRAFVIILAAAVSGVYWAARPYLVTFLLAAMYLWILEDFRWRRCPSAVRRLWWLPVFMGIWANSHGGFAVGFLLWGVYLVGELWAGLAVRPLAVVPVSLKLDRHFCILLAVGGLMLLAVCVNPSGPVMLAYPFKTVGIGALQDYIQEWQSPNFHELPVQPFAWMIFLIIGIVGASRRRLALTDFLLVAGFGYMGLFAGRNLALFALAASPPLTRHAVPLLAEIGRSLGFRSVPDGSRQAPSRAASTLNISILVVLFLAVVAKANLVVPFRENQEAWQKSLPVNAVEYLRASHPPGRLFNPYNWGGYLLWALPEYPVFVDGRTDLYNDEVIGEWLIVARAEQGWQDILDRYMVNLVLTEPDSTLERELRREPGWYLLFQDRLAVIYQRSMALGVK